MLFSNSAKLRLIERELRRRNKIDPLLISAGALTPLVSKRDIELLEDIAADYRERLENGARECSAAAPQSAKGHRRSARAKLAHHATQFPRGDEQDWSTPERD